MTAQQSVILCEEGHDPAFEIGYKVPEIFQKYCRLPEVEIRHVCVECHNTRPEFQRDVVYIKPLSGGKYQIVS